MEYEKEEEEREKEVKVMEDMEEKEEKQEEVEEDQGMLEKDSRLEEKKDEKPTKSLEDLSPSTSRCIASPRGTGGTPTRRMHCRKPAVALRALLATEMMVAVEEVAASIDVRSCNDPRGSVERSCIRNKE